MLKVVRAKLHGIRVTGADLNYHGSVTLDPEHCDLAGIYPLEFVEIWNKSSGARISTYVIHGEAGSRCCILNGAAARTCQAGDELIIAAAEYCEASRLYDLKPRILTFLPNNEIDQVLNYDVSATHRRAFDFRIVDADKHTLEACHTYPNVDVAAIRESLAERGWSEREIEDFIAEHFTL
jgi:aspartate 1-decarboxylase